MSSSQTESLKFEDSLNTHFNIYKTENGPSNSFMIKTNCDVNEYKIFSQFITGISVSEEELTDTNSLFVLDEISVNNEIYLITNIIKETGSIYEIQVSKKLEHEVVSNSPVSKIVHKDKIDNFLKKIVYENYSGDSEKFEDVFNVAKKAFSIGLNANLIRDMVHYDTNMIKIDENDGGIHVGFKS